MNVSEYNAVLKNTEGDVCCETQLPFSSSWCGGDPSQPLLYEYSVTYFYALVSPYPILLPQRISFSETFSSKSGRYLKLIHKVWGVWLSLSRDQSLHRITSVPFCTSSSHQLPLGFDPLHYSVLIKTHHFTYFYLFKPEPTI